MLETATTKQIVEAMNLGCYKYLAVEMLGSLDKLRYGKLCEDLENNFTKGSKNFPVSATNAYNLFTN
jgi:hypothetical protein